MPMYEYKCEKGHVIQRFADIKAPGEPVDWIPCPKCPPPVVKRGRRAKTVQPVRAEFVYSLTGVPRFKAGGAGGFYKPNA